MMTQPALEAEGKESLICPEGDRLGGVRVAAPAGFE